jgi:hypothetical protein
MANTPENSADPTNSQHTIAVVLAVRNLGALPVERPRLEREQERTRRADGRRFGRRGDSEQNDAEHNEGKNAERHHRRREQLDDLEPVGVDPRVIADHQERAEHRDDAEPHIKGGRRPAVDRLRGHLGRAERLQAFDHRLGPGLLVDNDIPPDQC